MRRFKFYSTFFKKKKKKKKKETYFIGGEVNCHLSMRWWRGEISRRRLQSANDVH